MKRKTILLLVLMLSLALCLCACGTDTNQPANNAASNTPAADQLTDNNPATGANDSNPNSENDNADIIADADQTADNETDNTPAATQPADKEPADDGKLTCTISISCATLLNNQDLCAPDKVELIPADGWVLKATTTEFYAGENVFNVLQRICKENRIHLEFMNTPLYNSAYIEGLHNLYEFDAGELSGWMYSVNGWFPNYGCSRYELQDGDVINWVYTCDLGKDVGGDYASGNNSAQ